LKQNVTIQKNNEIGQFASSFNTMINNLAKSKEELLGTNNELQKEIIKRKEQETILVQQSRFIAMGEMISMIAHQWRQPLNSIGLIVQNLELRAKMSGTDDKSLSDNVDKVMKILEQMSKTIEDFRNFFKPNKSINSFSLYEMVNSVYLLIEDSLSAKGIDVKIEKSDLQISCYESELSQVIINLINNSRDALADNKVDNPYINISFAQIDSDNVQIVIKDNAGGIPLEIQEKIFDPYFSTKEDRNGTGIGLYMSKVIIEKNMLGKLYFNNLENGVEFIIQLKKALTIGD
jgi:signal transduction histidine kinase